MDEQKKDFYQKLRADIINEVDPKIIQRNWAGDRDILPLIKTIIANANNMVGGGIWKKIKRTFGY